MDSRPIGVYDSGMGGLSLWCAIRQLLPNESTVYLGDGKNCPYGDKSPEEVISFAVEAVELLLKHDCKMIVIACNTATSTAIHQLRELYPQIPFVGMEPAIKPACKETKSGVVGVLATKRSLESDMFASAVAHYANGIEVITHVGDGFVELVEAGLEDSEAAYNVVKPIVEMMAANSVDEIVLGCTHYPFLLKQITRAINGRKINVIDPSPAIVRQIEKVLKLNNISASAENVAKCNFISFADDIYCKKLADRANSAMRNDFMKG